MNGTETIAAAGPYPYTSPHDGNLHRVRPLFHRPARIRPPSALALLELGVAENRIYTDHGLTGTTRARPGSTRVSPPCAQATPWSSRNSIGWPDPSRMPAPSPTGFGNAA